MPEGDNHRAFSLRSAGPNDAEFIHGLILSLCVYEREDPASAVQASPESLRVQLQADRPPFGCVLAEREGVNVGFALYFLNYSTWTGRVGMHLEDLFVMPESRGLGIGRALITRLAEITHELGGARLEWAVLDWNKPAMDFFESLGADELSGWTTYRLAGDALRGLAGVAQTAETETVDTPAPPQAAVNATVAQPVEQPESGADLGIVAASERERAKLRPEISN